MEAFLNEKSLSGQYSTALAFENAVKLTTNFVKRARELNMSVFYDSLVGCQAIGGNYFDESLGLIADISVQRYFRATIYNRQEATMWRNDRKSVSSWTLNTVDVSDSSVAECAERKLNVKHQPYLLMNFPESCFAGHNTIEIVKNGAGASVALHCCDDDVSWANWMADDYRKYVYDPSSGVAPTPEQTILRDSSQFQSIPHRTSFGRNEPFREISTNRVWYVDRFHFGGAAHLEVFSDDGTHVGEANLDGSPRLKTKDKDKTFRV